MKLLTASEACERLRIKDVKTLYKLIRSGDLPAMKVGPGDRASYRISEKALEDYLKRNTVKPDPEAVAR